MLFNTILKANQNQLGSKLKVRYLMNKTRNPPDSLLFRKVNKFTIKSKSNGISSFVQDLAKATNLRRFNRTGYYQNEHHLLTTVYSSSGAIADMPKWYRFGLFKIVATIVTFVMIGSFISKAAVTFLEENDIFKPEDDDDDDDD